MIQSRPAGNTQLSFLIGDFAVFHELLDHLIHTVLDIGTCPSPPEDTGNRCDELCFLRRSCVLQRGLTQKRSSP